MRAMILKCPGNLTPGDVAKPVPKDGEALVRVSHSGICGTDVKIYRGDIPADYPRIMGHEMIGVVAQDVPAGPVAGTRVIVDPAYYCGACHQCRAGQNNLCPSGGLIGRDRDGGFADFVAVPAENIFALPDEIDDEDATLIQVLTTCVHAQGMCPVKPGEAVVVIGLGVTGQLHVQLAKSAGACPVIGMTRSAWKRKLATKIGADAALDPCEDFKGRILELTDGRGADLIIETTGHLPALARSIDLARAGGRVIPFGIYTGTQAELPFYQLYFKELQIFNTRAATGADFAPSIDLVKQEKLRLKPLISHKMPLEALPKALGTLESADSRSMKIILQH